MEKTFCDCFSGKAFCDCKIETAHISNNTVMQDSELLKQLAQLNDKYLALKEENERLKKLVDNTADHYKEIGIMIGKSKFSLIDFVRGFSIGLSIMALINLITNP